MKTAKWMRDAYKSTEINWVKSQSKIMEMLGDVGVDGIRFTNMPDKIVLEFMVPQDESPQSMGVRIVTPIRAERDRTKELNSIHRILYHHLRAKFIAVGTGLTEFQQEFMSHLIITDKSGKTSTMGEALLPQYNKNLEDRTTPVFLLGE